MKKLVSYWVLTVGCCVLAVLPAVAQREGRVRRDVPTNSIRRNQVGLSPQQEKVVVVEGEDPTGKIRITTPDGKTVKARARVRRAVSPLSQKTRYVGGPNPGQQDKDVMRQAVYPSNIPDESYIDDTESYASNEIAINWNASLVAFIGWLDALCQPSAATAIRSGELWPDDKGEHINAHGGGILRHGDTWYWFGEHKSERTSNALVGVTCYASKDLINWRNCGVALAVSDERGHDIERGCIIERPKVIYNAATKKFCMWFHLELKGRGYNAARYGVAVSDRPEGPYQFLYSQRANAGTWPVEFDAAAIAVADTLAAAHYKDWTPAWLKAVDQGLFVKRDLASGQMSRDMTLYVDDDGKAYHIFSSEENLTLHIAELTDDYLHHTGRYTRVAPAGHNEAPAIFKHDGTYWMITSGCTGWAPNEARMFSAPSIWGPWTQHPNPCRGPKAEITFGGQSTFILPVGNHYIFMADIWRLRHPIDARYIWLPIEFEDGKPVVRWQDEWTWQEFEPTRP